MTIKGAIFDLDGTIFDSMPFWENIGINYLTGIGIVPPADLNETIKPLSFEQTAQYFIDELSVPYPVKKIIEQVNAMIASAYKNDIPLKPYAKELIEHLKNMGMKLCVATAMDQALAKAALKRTGILDYFEFINTCADLGLGKDTPEFFRLTGERLNTLPSETIVFEDALHAIISAKEAGFLVAGIFDEAMETDAADIKKYSDIYVTSLKEMEKFL